MLPIDSLVLNITLSNIAESLGGGLVGWVGGWVGASASLSVATYDNSRTQRYPLAGHIAGHDPEIRDQGSQVKR